MAKWTDGVYLDRLIEVTGTYDSNNDETTWTLPITDDSLDTIVLGPQHGGDAGLIFAPDSNSGGTVTLAGKHDDGPVAIGRSFTMSVELSQPFVRDNQGNADADAWVQIRKLTAKIFQTGALTIRSSMYLRNDRKKELYVGPLITHGTLEAWHNGRADGMIQYLENDKPKPSTVNGLEYIVDYAPRQG